MCQPSQYTSLPDGLTLAAVKIRRRLAFGFTPPTGLAYFVNLEVGLITKSPLFSS